MHVYMIVRHYPVALKPYYDTQFSDLIEEGHDLTIFSRGALDPDTVNEKVTRYRLDERTRRFPELLSGLPPALGACLRGGLRRPLTSLRLARRMQRRRDGRSWKGRLLDLARMLVVNAGAPDVVFVHGLGTAVLFRWLPLVFPETPRAMYYHGGEVAGMKDLPDDVAAETFGAFEVVFTNTRASRRQAAERGCPEERLHVLPVGFDIDAYPPPPREDDRRDGPLRLLSAGRLSEEKGIIYALRAVERLVGRGIEDVRYDIAGDGHERGRLERFVTDRGLEEHVRFLGVLSTEEVKAAMDRADVLVLPSLTLGNWAETQACSVQEAMLKECLAVTTRTGGVPESIPECMQKFSVPERDPEALADAVEEIHGMSAETRRELGLECRAFVVENYDIRELNRRMLSVIRQASTLRTTEPGHGEAERSGGNRR